MTTPTLDAALYATLQKMAQKVAKGLDPEELLQSTALRIVRARLLERWRAERGPVEAYLYVIVRSEAASMRRTARRKAERQAAFVAAATQRAAAAREEELRLLLASKTVGSWCRERLAQLSPHAAEVYQLIVGGHSRRQVRAMVGPRAERQAYDEMLEVLRAGTVRVGAR